MAVAVQALDSIVQALLPIATTYLAARTTTALADAYNGVDGAASQALLFVVLTSLVSVVMLTWDSFGSYISKKSRYKIGAAVEEQMMTKFGSLPFELYDDKNVVDLHDRAKRFSYVFSYIFGTIGTMLTSIVSVIGSIAALLVVSPLLAGILLLVVLPGALLQIRLTRQQAGHWAGNVTTRRRKGNMGWMVADSQYIAEMRVYGVLKYLLREYARLRDTDEKQRVDIELSYTWKQLAAKIAEAGVELGSLIWVVLEIVNRSQPVGQFVFVQQLVSRAISSANQLGGQLGQVDEDLANMVDYQEFMSIAPMDDGKKVLRGLPDIVRFDNVSFTYPKTDIEVLKRVSFQLEKGQKIAIVGENGAGKSTLIKLLMGLYRPSSGTITCDGVALNEYRIDSWHQQIGLLDQKFITYYFATIRENITLGNVRKQPTDDSLNEALRIAEFDGVVKKLEHGMDTYVERWMARDNDEATATELSGGQYQRLALARNFYRDAPLLILDEPTSAIDALAEERIFKRLFTSDKTIVVISHRFSTIEKADVIYMLKDGRIVESGSARQLIDKQGAFYAMFKEQIGK